MDRVFITESQHHFDIKAPLDDGAGLVGELPRLLVASDTNAAVAQDIFPAKSIGP